MSDKDRVTIHQRFDKKLIASLPRVTFPGRIITIIDEASASKAVDYLLAQDIIGLDTETKPSFKRGSKMRKVALLQVSTHDTCFLFRLNRIGMPPCLVRLLQQDCVKRIGLSFGDDIRALHGREEFTPGHYIDIQNEVKKIGIDDMSLQKIYANLFGEKISKNQQLSNWEADSLSVAQQQYASTDAWACIQIYERIQQLVKSDDYTYIPYIEVVEDEAVGHTTD